LSFVHLLFKNPTGAKTPELILMTLGMVDQNHNRQDTYVGVAQCGWSGKICDLSHLWVSFLSFFFLLSLPSAQVALLTDRDDLYLKTRVSSEGCAF